MRTLSLTLLLALATVTAQAADPKAPPAGGPGVGGLKIAVVDAMRAVGGSDQYKKALADLEKDLAGDRAKLSSLQNGLNTCKQKMSGDYATMSATDQVKLKNDCENKQREYLQLGQQYNKVVGEREQAMLRDIGPKLQQAIDAVAKEGGYDMVIQREALPFVKPGFDISDKVTIKLNALK